jgi:hypothetical protein
MPRSSKFNRLVVAGIAAAAISPTAALASPAIDGGVSAPGTGVVQDMRAPDQVAGGAPGTGVMQDMRAPDQVDGTTVDTPTPAGMPTWPANPQPISNPVATTSTPVADDDGIDGGVLVAIGGGALLLVGGIGLANRKRLQLVRQRQPA